MSQLRVWLIIWQMHFSISKWLSWFLLVSLWPGLASSELVLHSSSTYCPRYKAAMDTGLQNLLNQARTYIALSVKQQKDITLLFELRTTDSEMGTRRTWWVLLKKGTQTRAGRFKFSCDNSAYNWAAVHNKKLFTIRNITYSQSVIISHTSPGVLGLGL